MFSRQTAPLIIGMTLLVAGSGFAAAAQDTPTAAPAAAQAPNPKVGGAEMLATKTIPENASAAPNLTTLVTAATAAGLTYHVVPGTITLVDLKTRADANGGKVTLTTVEGEPLIVEVAANAFAITDVNGNKAYIETPDVRQSNGVVHVINGVLIPKLG